MCDSKTAAFPACAIFRAGAAHAHDSLDLGRETLGSRIRNPVDVISAWNVANDPDLGFDAGRVPTLDHELFPAWTTPILVPLLAGSQPK